MPKKTSTSSQSSSRRSSKDRVGLTCPADLPGLSLAVVCKSAQSQPRHVHDSFVLGVVTAGARRIDTRCGGAQQSVRVFAGNVFALPPGLAHACAPAPAIVREETAQDETAHDAPRCSYLAFSLAKECLPQEMPQALPVRLDAPGLARTLENLAEAVLTPAGRLERQSLLAEALERLWAHARPQQNGEQERDDGLAAAVRHAQKLLTAEPGQSLPELAQACGVDPYALHRAFTRRVGLPPHAFQTHQRLRRAKELLRAGASLTDAALGADFCDQSHMNRHFARLVGLTPAQYAKAHANRD